jgi:ferredoxin
MLRQAMQQLLDGLHQLGYTCLGPVADEHAISLKPVRSASQLACGLEAEQSPGHYRLIRASHVRNFSWANLPQALKPLTFAPREQLWHCRRDATGTLSFEAVTPQAEAIAVIGVRGCDLAALQLQKQHFLNTPNPDPWFQQRLDKLFIVAVHCSHPASTCFCAASGDGPAATDGFDLALHELEDGFIVESGSARGETLARRLPLVSVSATQHQTAQQQLHWAAQQQRTLPNAAAQTLMQNLEHPRWRVIGERCLACGNCTAVCPSCFCHQQHEQVDVSDQTSVHTREWSSCFNHAHGYLAGYQMRPTTASRYRQWLTHKFSSWHDQYGRSGCVGCGRCIAWCPVGIDVTAELHKLCAPS